MLPLALPVLVLAAHITLHIPHALAAGDAGAASGSSAASFPMPPLSVDTLEGRMNMKVLHEDARIFLFEKFLTPEECDAIIKAAEPRLEPSVIVNKKDSDAINTTKLVQSTFRTSWGMFFGRGENDVLKAVEERIAAWTHIPVYNGEGVQVLRYQQNQHYGAHWDFFQHKAGINNGGNRYATVLTYLTDVEEGGETTFPFIPAPEGQDKSLSECARKTLAVKPRKGDALLFHSVKPNGDYERRSQHQACPVIKGEKWAMTKWLHVGRYAIGNEEWHAVQQTVHPIPSDKPQCADQHEKCDEWAMDSQCTSASRAAAMVGDADKPGQCLFACRRCDVWLAHLAKHPQPPAAAAQPQQAKPAEGNQGGGAGTTTAQQGAQPQQQQAQQQQAQQQGQAQAAPVGTPTTTPTTPTTPTTTAAQTAAQPAQAAHPATVATQKR